MTDVEGDRRRATPMAARAAQHLGRFREAEAARDRVHRARARDRLRLVPARAHVARRGALRARRLGRRARRPGGARAASRRSDPRELPLGLRDGARTRASRSATSCAASATRRIGTSSWRCATSTVRHAHSGGSIHLPPLALALARRGRFDEALGADPARAAESERRRDARGAVRDRGRARAAGTRPRGLVAAARDEAEVGEQLVAAPLRRPARGPGAAAAGDVARAVELLAPVGRRVRRARGALGGGVVAPPAGRGCSAQPARRASSAPRRRSSSSSARSARRSAREPCWPAPARRPGRGCVSRRVRPRRCGAPTA